MSSLAAIYSKNCVVLGTDTMCIKREPFEKANRIVNETASGVHYKTIYYPHIEAAVSILGSQALARIFHEYMDFYLDIYNMDQLVLSMETQLVQFLKGKNLDHAIADESNPNFMGMVMIAGLSRIKQSGSGNLVLRGENSIRLVKVLIYKDKVVFTVMNGNDESDFCFTPPLPNNKAVDIYQNNIDSGAEKVIVECMIEANRIYETSNRYGHMTGGEVTITILNIVDGRFIASQYKAYRFNDFNEIMREVRTSQYERNKIKELSDFKTQIHNSN